MGCILWYFLHAVFRDQDQICHWQKNSNQRYMIGAPRVYPTSPPSIIQCASCVYTTTLHYRLLSWLTNLKGQFTPKYNESETFWCYIGFPENGIVIDISFAMRPCVNVSLGFVHRVRDVAFLFALINGIKPLVRCEKAAMDSQSLSSGCERTLSKCFLGDRCPN